MARYREMVWAAARVVVGVLFASHGAQKLFGWFGSQPVTGKPLMLAGGVIELVCGLLVAVGLFARPAAIVAAGEMAVAYFVAHAPHGPWPLQNRGEAAVLYCFFFLAVAAHGAGLYAVDAARGRPALFSARRRAAV